MTDLQVNIDAAILCSARNGVYVNVVARVWEAFQTEEVVRLDCTHVGMSDCKRIGVKLRVFSPPLVNFWYFYSN